MRTLPILRSLILAVAIQAPQGALAHQRGALVDPRPDCPPCPTCGVNPRGRPQPGRPDGPRPMILIAPCVRTAQVVRTSSRAILTLEGRILRYEITETFTNRGTMIGETDYLLPLPARAAFEDLALSINGEMVTGETLHADRARAIYEEIVRRQRDPALVEWMGQGLLRTRIFPIAPGETKTVVVRFRAVAEREGDALRIDYRPPTRTGEGSVTSTFELRYPARGEFGRAFSPTHDLRATAQGGVRTARTDGVVGIVSVLVPVRSGIEGSVHVLTHAASGDDGFAMITIAPPTATRGTTPRDVTFVIDVSGSMQGAKLDQAKAAGRALLQSLNGSDRFRLIAFSTDVRDFREGWSVATTSNLRSAQQYLRDLTAGGSTNISGALEETLTPQGSEDRLPVVLFLTDGEPTVGERQPARITALAERLRGRARVFTFGVGADVNASLLEQLALSGHGTAQFVRPEEDVEHAVDVVAQRLTRPVATDLHVRVNGVRVNRVQPAGDLDLFAGQELTVFARYRGIQRGATVTVEGTSADGPVRWSTTADFPARTDENAFVSRLWAVQRAGWLSAERRRNGASQEIDDELRTLGTRFGIPTELTSYLVVEPGLSMAPGPQRPDLFMSTAAPMAASGRTPAPRTMGGGTVANGAVSGGAQRAFESAKAAADQRAVTTVSQLERSEGTDHTTQRFAMGRLFTQRNGQWQDAPPEGVTTRVVRVRAFSEAYFALLARIPALREALALGERVSVQGRAVRLEIDPAGPSTLDARTLDALARDW